MVFEFSFQLQKRVVQEFFSDLQNVWVSGAPQMFCPPDMRLGGAATLKSAESVEASPPSGLSWRIQATFLEQIST